MSMISSSPDRAAPPASGWSSRIPWFVDGIVLTAVGLALLGATWRYWADVLVDFGRELYVPWQLSLGKVLYRDIAYFNGPLSPYLNSLAMRCFGVSMSTLIGCNIAVLALICIQLHWLLRRISGRSGAFIGTLLMLTVFVAPFRTLGNSNYLCPYSHEITHGLLLALSCLACFVRFIDSGASVWAYLSGLALGLVALTKPEILAATGLALCVGLGLLLGLGHIAPSRILRLTPGILLAMALAPAGALLLLSQTLPFADALAGIFAGPRWALDPRLAGSVFYRHLFGTDYLKDNLTAAATWGAAIIVILGIAWLADWRLRRRWAQIVTSVVMVCGIAALAAYGWDKWIWEDMLQPVPAFLLYLLASRMPGLRKPSPASADALIAFIVMAFALGLLAKIFFNVTVYPYGFVLAMPATVVIAAALCVWAPDWLQRRGARGTLFRIVVLALLAIAASRTITTTLSKQPRLRFWIGNDGDRFRCDGRGQATDLMIQELERIAGPHDTLAVLPEGVMINYLTRRENPTPFINFMPPELVMFGEQNMLRAFEARPPDFIILAHKDTTEYGLPLFGKDYGVALEQWIEQHYEVLRVLGNRPLQAPQKGGILLAKHKIP